MSRRDADFRRKETLRAEARVLFTKASVSLREVVDMRLRLEEGLSDTDPFYVTWWGSFETFIAERDFEDGERVYDGICRAAIKILLPLRVTLHRSDSGVFDIEPADARTRRDALGFIYFNHHRLARVFEALRAWPPGTHTWGGLVLYNNSTGEIRLKEVSLEDT